MNPPPLAPRFGLGLRKPHYAEVLAGDVPLDFVEVISENFMVPGGRPREVLRRVREHYPVALHGVSLSIGSSGGIDPDYLARLAALVDAVEPVVVSDHLCWTRPGPAAMQTHDLLPLPYTGQALALAAENIDRAQTALRRPLLIENPSTYIVFAASEMTEWAFLSELVRRTGCALLLDVNNIFVSGQNHGWNPLDYLEGLPLERVEQVHLAGHTLRRVGARDLLVDTHDQPVRAEVWALYAEAMARVAAAGAAPLVMIERDDNIPPLEELLGELATARRLAQEGVAA